MVRVEVYQKLRPWGKHKWYWRMWASSDKIANPGQGYVDRNHVIHMLEEILGGFFIKTGNPDNPEPWGHITRPDRTSQSGEYEDIPVKLMMGKPDEYK